MICAGCKMVIDDATNGVLGVSLVTRDAGEVIQEAAMGIRLGATFDDFADLLHVYPPWPRRSRSWCPPGKSRCRP